MNIRKMIKHYILGVPLKEIEICRILGKICKESKLTKKEQVFLNLYNQTQIKKKEDRDFMLLSKSVVSDKINDLLESGKKVICNLTDRDGKIGLSIIKIINNYEEETSIVVMKDNLEHKLHDKFLYNLIYNTNKDFYSLEEQDEYFEKIEVNND
jgi:hypothetical protein